MLLYSAPPSYYSMIARLALNESKLPFDTRYMDIHIAKDQLSPWYIAVNPSMTVPSLTDANTTWTDSRDILKLAATKADGAWCDADPALSQEIEKIVCAHYNIPIEKLTFGKVMTRSYPLRKIFPMMLSRIIKHLEAEALTIPNPEAAKAKIAVNQERLAYFTEGNQIKKLDDRREEVRQYLAQLPHPQALLFGEKMSSADVVSAILYARLIMIGENKLMNTSPSISKWFDRMKMRPAFIKSDVWMHFKPWRILMRY